MGEGEKKERMETVMQQQQNQVPSTLPEMEQVHISRERAHIKSWKGSSFMPLVSPSSLNWCSQQCCTKGKIQHPELNFNLKIGKVEEREAILLLLMLLWRFCIKLSRMVFATMN